MVEAMAELVAEDALLHHRVLGGKTLIRRAHHDAVIPAAERGEGSYI